MNGKVFESEEDYKTKGACSGVRDDLRHCLLESDCVKLVMKELQENLVYLFLISIFSN